MIEHETRIASPAESAARYRTPSRSHYDLAIIGGGSAGLPAAGLAAAFGVKVALIDRERLGGECLYTGCVPSKALLHVARTAAAIRRVGALGLGVRLDPIDLGAVADRVQAAIGEVYVESDAPEHYRAMGVDVVFGQAQFASRSALTINGQTITARRYLICTGSHPAVPPIPGLAEAGYLTNDSIFDVRRLPPRLLVIGGGPIGAELGQAFVRLGSRVTIFQRPDRLIPKDEPEASALLHQRLAAEGVVIHTSAEVRSIEQRGNEQVVSARGPEGAFELTVDAILVATGRAPTVEGLGLAAAGVTYDAKSGIGVDAYLRTSNPRIYAAGDVTGGYIFTHAAAKEALAATRNALFPSLARAALDERVMPWATFTEPEVAHVGATEAEARRQHGAAVRCYTQPFKAVDRAITDAETEGFIKLVCKRDGTLLGAQIIGPSAGELINELALAMQNKLSVGQIAATTHVYPTLALGIQQAAGKFSVEKATGSALARLLLRLAR